MAKETVHKEKNLNTKEDDDLEDHPIKLLDPPKTKLKRQLSIDTVDRTDELRVRKRPAILRQSDLGQDIPSRKDEVDGGRPSSSANVVHFDTPRHYTASVYETRVNTTKPVTVVTSSVRENAQLLPEIVYDATDMQKSYNTEYVPLPSPNRFNLSDIGLTSPFTSRTHAAGGNRTNEQEVFVFPDTIPPRKLSPYKNIHGDYRDTDVPETREGYSILDRLTHESVYRKETFPDSETTNVDNQDEEQTNYSSCHLKHHRQNHVSERGFSWPEKATITEPVQFSPRIVSTETRPRFPSTVLSNNERSKKAQEENELKARLRVLEREYARAKEVYGSPHDATSLRQMSPTSRNVESLRRGTLRSFSNNDRSPNEKDIREISEEVRNRYDRSLSDPRCSPRQMYDAIMRPSPLCRQYDEPSRNSLPQDRYSECWREDAKRRLFVKSDSSYVNDYRRQNSSQYSRPTAHQSTEIPREVLSLLHAQNFHPESLENLKDVFRRNNPQHGLGDEEGIYPRVPQDHFESSREAYGRYRQNRSAGRRDISYEEWNPPRERLPGEIDVRLTCESIKENTKKTDEILQELEHDNKDCKCAQIEHEIRLMAMDAYSKIRRTDRSAEAHDQFQNELNETNANVYMSMRVLCGIKCLCKYGRTIEEVFSGSVVFRIKCPNVDALLDLWHFYKDGELQKQMKDAFISEELLQRHGCEDVDLKVEIDWKNYLDCKQELESSIVGTPTKSPLTPVHGRTRSEPASVTKQANQVLLPKTAHSPFRERFCSDSSVELSPRRAFQELNAGKHPVHPPPSPSKKYTRDNVFFDESSRSPLTSPRGKTSFVFKPQNERENVDAGDPCVV
ncbi:uncharacterized protein LOC132722060 isoform X2 [Ruditapes philippinarum]|uniref:uncharacterized protein LOC132722060 isoform X2 n=1 Tax=Ruditapes philippinarum TaxID=129788 RepID=UPI00295B7EC0|nr:uncharacterized protein LOC132722060 isoform X2 [Ruditapes philippinarum]